MTWLHPSRGQDRQHAPPGACVVSTRASRARSTMAGAPAAWISTHIDTRTRHLTSPTRAMSPQTSSLPAESGTLLQHLQNKAFAYFQYETDPHTGLVRDKT